MRFALSHVSPQFYHFFVGQAYSGARPNELQALRWSHIDWKNEQISITKGHVRGKEWLPKTASGQRLVPMTAPVKKALIDFKRKRDADGLVSLESYVFTTKNARPIIKHMDRIWAQALKKPELRHRPSYQLPTRLLLSASSRASHCLPLQR